MHQNSQYRTRAIVPVGLMLVFIAAAALTGLLLGGRAAAREPQEAQLRQRPHSIPQQVNPKAGDDAVDAGEFVTIEVVLDRATEQQQAFLIEYQRVRGQPVNKVIYELPKRLTVGAGRSGFQFDVLTKADTKELGTVNVVVRNEDGLCHDENCKFDVKPKPKILEFLRKYGADSLVQLDHRESIDPGRPHSIPGAVKLPRDSIEPGEAVTAEVVANPADDQETFNGAEITKHAFAFDDAMNIADLATVLDLAATGLGKTPGENNKSVSFPIKAQQNLTAPHHVLIAVFFGDKYDTKVLTIRPK